MIQEDKSSNGECFKQLYTGFLYLCSLLWPAPQEVATLTSKLLAATLSHNVPCYSESHEVAFIAQATFLTSEQPHQPSEGISAAESPG